MTEKHRFFVPHCDTAVYEALGWQFVDFLPPPLAAHSELYEWPHDTPPVFPFSEKVEKED